MDLIYYRYRGTMFDFNGNTFQVDWAAADPKADDFVLPTPFRSGIWADTRPYWIGDVGEIPARFYPASRQRVPKRICLQCYIGNNAWWESGWPLLTPPVVLAPDGWPEVCDAGGPMFDCSCSALAVDYFPNALHQVAACSCSKVTTEYTAHAHFAVSACSCSRETISYGDHVEIGVNVCSCSSPSVEYTQTAYFAVTACSCSKELLIQTAHVTHAVSVCSCSKVSVDATAHVTWSTNDCTCSAPTFTYETHVPLTSFNCANLTATGSTAADAAPIGDDTVYITSTGFGQGVILPSGCYRIATFITGGRNVICYPPTGENIGGNPPSAGVTMFAGNGYIIIRFPGGNWHWWSADL